MNNTITSLIQQKLKNIEKEFCKTYQKFSESNNIIFNTLSILSDYFIQNPTIYENKLVEILLNNENLSLLEKEDVKIILDFLENNGFLQRYIERSKKLLSPKTVFYMKGIQPFFDYILAVCLIEKMTIRTIINDNPAEYDFDGIKKCMIEMYDYEDGNIPDKDVWEYIYNDIEYSYDEGLRDLNVDTEGDIIAIASMGLWNGRCSGYAILDKNNLKEILYYGNKDFNHLYYDGFNVYKKASHHDGTNHIMFREVRPDVDIEKLFDKIYNNEPISKATLNRYTRSLRRYVKQIYGW